jgi:activator of 2-hydroxyglutaryl-CoA dehydratase
MSPHFISDLDDTLVAAVDIDMPSRVSSCVIGIDVGGTNTDAVVLRDERVLGWHKTPTTSDIQEGVELAIEAVVKKAEIPASHVGAVKIGTTVSQFMNSQICFWPSISDFVRKLFYEY